MNVLIDALLKDALLSRRSEALVLCDTKEILDPVLRDLRASLEEAGAKVFCGVLPKVMGDDVQLSQLLQNLVVNAVRHSGVVAPNIYVSAEPSGDVWCFSVEDDGAGIPEEARERVFLPFERAHRKGDPRSVGSGIGLATCKRIVERHGGKIWIEASLYGGANFRFTLPAS